MDCTDYHDFEGEIEHYSVEINLSALAYCEGLLRNDFRIYDYLMKHGAPVPEGRFDHLPELGRSDSMAEYIAEQAGAKDYSTSEILVNDDGAICIDHTILNIPAYIKEFEPEKVELLRLVENEGIDSFKESRQFKIEDYKNMEGNMLRVRFLFLDDVFERNYDRP